MTEARIKVTLAATTATPRPFGLNSLPEAVTNTVIESHRQLPLTLPAEQGYYWTTRWQTEERETLDSLARGHGRRFESADDALRYLFSSDD